MFSLNTEQIIAIKEKSAINGICKLPNATPSPMHTPIGMQKLLAFVDKNKIIKLAKNLTKSILKKERFERPQNKETTKTPPQTFSSVLSFKTKFRFTTLDIKSKHENIKALPIKISNTDNKIPSVLVAKYIVGKTEIM